MSNILATWWQLAKTTPLGTDRRQKRLPSSSYTSKCVLFNTSYQFLFTLLFLITKTGTPLYEGFRIYVYLIRGCSIFRRKNKFLTAQLSPCKWNAKYVFSICRIDDYKAVISNCSLFSSDTFRRWSPARRLQLNKVIYYIYFYFHRTNWTSKPALLIWLL